MNSLKSLSEQLSVDNFDAWITPYNLSEITHKKKVLVIMAGNIPLVGFHDFMSVIISGNNAIVKLSSNDNVLFPFIWDVMCEINPDISSKSNYIDDITVKKFDMESFTKL